MKRTYYISIAIFGILSSQSIILVEGSTQWNSLLSTSSFHWKSTLNQFTDTDLYSDGELVGII